MKVNDFFKKPPRKRVPKEETTFTLSNDKKEQELGNIINDLSYSETMKEMQPMWEEQMALFWQQKMEDELAKTTVEAPGDDAGDATTTTGN